jgi:tetratricopeptide (TPR) repeat protein
VLYFAGVLFPALSFASVFPMLYSFVADHFQYMASVGLISLAVAGAARSIAVLPGGRSIAWAASALVVVVLGSLTFSQARIYSSLETLWRDTLAKNPGAWMARANLASYLHATAGEIADPSERERRLDEALGEYLASLRLRPQNLPARINLAHLYEQRGDPGGAEAELRAAAEMENRYPPGSRGFLQHADAWYHLGRFLADRGRADEAVEAFERALEIRPDLDPALAALGGILARSGRTEAAEARLREALRVRPDSAGALNDLGQILAGRGEIAEAKTLWERALVANPNLAAAHNNLGAALLLEGRVEEALPHLHRALELDPDFALARSNLADALARLPSTGAEPTR